MQPEPRPLENSSDSQLMLRMNEGSSAAFGELYDRYASRALRVARTVCRSTGPAEEAVQDAFEGVWKSRATYRSDRGPVAPWLMSIVRYRAIAIARRRDHPLEREIDPEGSENASSPDQVVDNVVAAGEARHLRDLLGQIPPAQREVITLAFYGQLSHSEIAERLVLPAGTVKGRMRLGLAKLRTDLEATGSRSCSTGTG